MFMYKDDLFFIPTSLLVLVAVGMCLLHMSESQPNIQLKLKQEETEECVCNHP